MLVQPGLCQNCSETTLLVFPLTGSYGQFSGCRAGKLFIKLRRSKYTKIVITALVLGGAAIVMMGSSMTRGSAHQVTQAIRSNKDVQNMKIPSSGSLVSDTQKSKPSKAREAKSGESGKGSLGNTENKIPHLEKSAKDSKVSNTGAFVKEEKNSKVSNADPPVKETKDSKVSNIGPLVKETEDSKVSNVEPVATETKDSKVLNGGPPAKETKESKVSNTGPTVIEEKGIKVPNTGPIVIETKDREVSNAGSPAKETKGSKVPNVRPPVTKTKDGNVPNAGPTAKEENDSKVSNAGPTVNEEKDSKVSTSRSVVEETKVGKSSDIGPVVKEVQLDKKSNFRLGYTEKKVPLFKIYDALPESYSQTDMKLRFDEVKSLLTGMPDTKSKVIPQCTNSTQKIIWFDVWHNGSGMREQCRRVDFSMCKCKCEADWFIFSESDTSKYYEPLGGDAVLIQINKLRTIGHPPLKRPGQVFVAVEREPTAAGGIPSQNFEYMFNWTMTFRRDSDIFYPYGAIVPRIGATPAKDYSAIYKKKRKGIIWFVSHCRTRSRREDYAEELSKYIDIDIVGKCGRDICPKGDKECVEKLEEEYFFRFNLENDYLTDYVTEKLFDNFSKDMVQIVGGSANYGRLVPDKTVIDVKKFFYPKRLASYLKQVMGSEELYTEYLKTKDRYIVQSQWDVAQKAYCELCSMLHAQDQHKNMYYSISDWFRDLQLTDPGSSLQIDESFPPLFPA